MARTQLTPAQAEALLPDGDYIHTFTSPAPNVLCGADWKREQVLERIRDMTLQPPELAGPLAVAAGHGLAFYDRVHWVFVQTKEGVALPEPVETSEA